MNFSSAAAHNRKMSDSKYQGPVAVLISDWVSVAYDYISSIEKKNRKEIWITTNDGYKYLVFKGDDNEATYNRLVQEFRDWKTPQTPAATPAPVIAPAIAPVPVQPRFHPGAVLVVGTCITLGDWPSEPTTEITHYKPGTCPLTATETTERDNGRKQTCVRRYKTDEGLDVFVMKYERWEYDGPE